jgi:hypothetical protein
MDKPNYPKASKPALKMDDRSFSIIIIEIR